MHLLPKKRTRSIQNDRVFYCPKKEIMMKFLLAVTLIRFIINEINKVICNKTNSNKDMC
jgi:hypothetical protein